MSERKILFIFEGEKREQKFFSSCQNIIFPAANTVIIECYKNDIYELYKSIVNEEEFADSVNIFTVLVNQGLLSKEMHTRQDFAEIYLFFDYDPHDDQACDEKLKKMLQIFNDETDQGLLLISYPMVEALYETEHNADLNSFIAFGVERTLCVNFKTDIAKINIKNHGHDVKKYTADRWANLFIFHCQKANFVLTNCSNFPEMPICQKDLHTVISTRQVIPVISSFPLMFFSYHGQNSNKILTEHIANNILTTL